MKSHVVEIALVIRNAENLPTCLADGADPIE